MTFTLLDITNYNVMLDVIKVISLVIRQYF